MHGALANGKRAREIEHRQTQRGYFETSVTKCLPPSLHPFAIFTYHLSSLRPKNSSRSMIPDELYPREKEIDVRFPEQEPFFRSRPVHSNELAGQHSFYEIVQSLRTFLFSLDYDEHNGWYACDLSTRSNCWLIVRFNCVQQRKRGNSERLSEF